MPDNILIVDDEVEIADLIALYLENEDFTVFKYYNAADALKYIREMRDTWKEVMKAAPAGSKQPK